VDTFVAGAHNVTGDQNSKTDLFAREVITSKTSDGVPVVSILWICL